MPRTPKKPGESELRCSSAIRRIRVEKLFGRYTYDLKCAASATEASRLLILYGDNGSGKTTILKLVFNLLSHIDKQGHKSYVAKTRFKRLIIDLGGEVQVVAERRGRDLVGSYVAYVRRNGRIASRVALTTDKDNSIVRPPGARSRLIYEERFQRFLHTLEQLKLALFFVTDDRQFLRNIRRAPEQGVAASSRLRLRVGQPGGACAGT